MTAATKFEIEHLNQVQLRGRLAAAPEQRELPSGDLLTVFRVVVDRPASARGRIDTIDCASAAARVRRTLERASPGELIEVDGHLRRRFWRSPAGPTSRYEVEVATVKRAKAISAGRRSGS